LNLKKCTFLASSEKVGLEKVGLTLPWSNRTRGKKQIAVTKYRTKIR